MIKGVLMRRKNVENLKNFRHSKEKKLKKKAKNKNKMKENPRKIDRINYFLIKCFTL
jgi:hypothetical protein